jgi:hypothetical protein
VREARLSSRLRKTGNARNFYVAQLGGRAPAFGSLRKKSRPGTQCFSLTTAESDSRERTRVDARVHRGYHERVEIVASVVERAVRYRRRALIVAISGFVGSALPLLLTVAYPRIQREAVLTLFPLFIGIAMGAWGIVLVASWFGRASLDFPRKSGGLSGFAARAFNCYLAVLVTGWIGIAIGLIAWSIIALLLVGAGVLTFVAA